MFLPKAVLDIISKLNINGFRADVVGGCVRDSILGKIPGDYDITTDAIPDEMLEVFKEYKTVPTGIKHGTLTVIINSAPYEITTYRLDGEYKDNRHPDKVSFTRRLADDLSRRDFTVNAMCYNPVDGFTDIFGGVSDIENRIIRAVGDPMRRFSEDALRIMRALRFASVLDFNIEEKTSSAIFASAHLLKNISRERIFVEWKKLLSGAGAYRIIGRYHSVIAEAIPAIGDVCLPENDAFDSADAAVRELSLFAKTHGERSADVYRSAMESLHSDSRSKRFGADVLGGLSENVSSDSELAKLLVKAGEDVARGIVRLKIVLGLATQDVEARLSDLIERGIPYRLSDLVIDGGDLVSLGLRGKSIGDTQKRLLMLVAEGKLENSRDALLSAAAKFI